MLTNPVLLESQMTRKRVVSRTKWGAGLTGIGGILTLGLPLFLSSVIKSQLYMSSGFSPVRTVLDGEVPVPIYLKIYVFSIQNEEDFRNGGKARLKEMGPIRPHIDIMGWGDNDETMILSLTTRFEFDPSRSSGSQRDKITMVNLPIYSMGGLVRNMLRRYPLSFFSVPMAVGFLNLITLTHGEGLIKRMTVGEFVGGYPFSLLETVDVLTQPLKWMGVELPDYLDALNQRFGLLHLANNTPIEPLEFETGIGNTTLFKYRGFNNKWFQYTIQLVDFFYDPKCRVYNSTRGMAIPGHEFGPGTDTSDKIYAFEGNVCKLKYAKYSGYGMSWGVPTWRFQLPREMFSAPDTNRYDKCFCSTPDQPDLCDGLFDLGPCALGAPVALTYPHFLYASDNIKRNVDGLHPDPDKHQSYLDVHPSVGLPINGVIRLQVNLLMEPLTLLAGFSGIREAVLPYIWIEQEIDLPGFLGALPAAGLYPLMAIDYGSYLAMLGGLALLGYTGADAVRKRKLLFPSQASLQQQQQTPSSQPPRPPPPPPQQSPNTEIKNRYPLSSPTQQQPKTISGQLAQNGNGLSNNNNDYNQPPAYSPSAQKYQIRRSHFGTQTSPLNDPRPPSLSAAAAATAANSYRPATADRLEANYTPPGSVDHMDINNNNNNNN
ncbi:scavenger receptor class B member 1-like [Oppia nitens]|uniref:scavenger receptor class B member 1-like n=1 Tax=Oppia nitens TaxID=1686743 RepID=UPI0023DA361B|nr:scavenger receptor class B member 1-like [Oppia nitens]